MGNFVFMWLMCTNNLSCEGRTEKNFQRVWKRREEDVNKIQIDVLCRNLLHVPSWEAISHYPSSPILRIQIISLFLLNLNLIRANLVKQGFTSLWDKNHYRLSGRQAKTDRYLSFFFFLKFLKTLSNLA